MKYGIILGAMICATSALAELDYETTAHTTPDGWDYEFIEVPSSKGWKIAIVFPTDLVTSDIDPYITMLGTDVIIYSGYEGMDKADVAAQLENIQSNAEFGDQTDHYYLDVFLHEDEVEKITELFPKIMHNSSFNQDVLDDTRDNIIDSYERALLDASVQARFMMNAALNHGSGKSGNFYEYSADKLDAFTMDDVKAWFTDVQAHGGVKIAVAGKSEPELAEPLIDGLLSGFDQGAPLREMGQWKWNAAPRTWILEQPDLDKTAINLFAPIQGDVYPREYFSLGFLSTAMNGLDGRLNQAIREDLRATYGIGAYVTRTGDYSAALAMQGEIDPSLYDETKSAIDKIMHDLKTNGITQDEFDAYKERVLNYLKDARSDENDVAEEMISVVLRYKGAQTLQEVIDDIVTLTLDDVNPVIKNKLPAPDDFITVLVAPSAENIEADCVIDSLDTLDTCLE